MDQGEHQSKSSRPVPLLIGLPHQSRPATKARPGEPPTRRMSKPFRFPRTFSQEKEPVSGLYPACARTFAVPQRGASPTEALPRSRGSSGRHAAPKAPSAPTDPARRSRSCGTSGFPRAGSAREHRCRRLSQRHRRGFKANDVTRKTRKNSNISNIRTPP